MKNSKNNLFIIDWILHIIIGSLIPILSMLKPNIIPFDWRWSVIILVLSIPWEGYILLMKNWKDKLEQICLRAAYLYAILAVIAFMISNYAVIYSELIYHNFYILYYWVQVFLAIGASYRTRIFFKTYVNTLNQRLQITD
jgi:cation transport ATPase